ncbi:MAG: bifunctional molybdenum cofactor biosynthesis protein MoaC/MoaB [Patulibacter sp.]|nr:bifunctional molybdenum cofactor biosynthesis protein MoaC/MoaB [Patulibacter sp.]
MTSTSIEIQVRLFAVLREAAGTSGLPVALPRGATAADAWTATWAALDREPPCALDQVALAVNREYGAGDRSLVDGDELALIPPVSGGQDPVDVRLIHAEVRAESLDQTALHALVADRRAGAIVTFCGTPRDVPQLDYEAHEAMAREQIAAILREVAATHGACAIAAEHRVGPVPWPEAAVVVAVSAPHRGEAFAAAREALDRIKAQAPIWKQEVDGERRAWVAGSVPTDAAREPGATVEIAADAPADAPAAVPGATDAAGPPAADAPLPPTDVELGRPGGVLPHLRPDGGATMVDVGAKPVTARRAVAAAVVTMAPATAALVQRGDLPKGDVLGTARLAGIMAAKRVPDLVPLAHPLPLTKVDVRIAVAAEAGEVRIETEVRTVGQTGIEIEAMTAALIAAINVYDMVKGVERGVEISTVRLIHKSGGRTGDFDAPTPWDGPLATASAGADDPTGPSAEPGVSVPGATAAPSPPTPAPRDARRPVDPPIRIALLTVSTSRADGPADDPGSVALRALAEALGGQVAVADRVRDDRAAIAARIAAFADDDGVDVVLTAGGTGMTVDDVTPEATLDACDRQVPGIAEALRLASRQHTHAWPLSRGVAAARGRTLVVNLPGSPKAAAEAEPVLAPVLDHVVRLLRR